MKLTERPNVRTSHTFLHSQVVRDMLMETDVEKLKRLQLALKKRRIKLLQGVQDPVKRSRTPQTPGSQYPTPSESLRPTVSVETHTRARSSSESSGVSSGSDIPFTAPGDTSRPISHDSDDNNDDAVSNSHQQKNSNAITESYQKAYQNEMGVSVSGLLSSRKPQVAQNQDRTQNPKPFQEDGSAQNPKPFQGDGSAKHQLHGNEDLARPPLKKQKTETAPSPAEIETIDLSGELPMWKEKVDTPTKHQPAYSTTGKKRQGQKRTRNNFTDYEKEHAPAWFKSQVNAGKTPSEIEKAYVEEFGVFHRWLTVKLWVDRMDERAAKAEKTVKAENPSKIVVLKVQLPSHLRLAFLNDNPP